ncbi:hypothetical protein OROGR_023829 [Orobanche gracilis]
MNINLHLLLTSQNQLGAMRRALKFGIKTSLYLLSATSFASLTYDSFNSTKTLDLPSSFLNGIVRSSRAVFAITSCVVDCKYSLQGLPTGSDEYRAALYEVRSRYVYLWHSCRSQIAPHSDKAPYGYSIANSEGYLKAKLHNIHLRSAGRILTLCDANKGFYAKAGQFVAAMRQVPKEYSSTLSSLQDQAVPCNFKAVKEVIVKSLGKDLSEMEKFLSGYQVLIRDHNYVNHVYIRFYSFDEQPVAAASIAQVHHAFLKDHQEVAVKVQYPGLEYQMKFDLKTMAFLSRSVTLFFPEYRFEWLLTEFTKSIASELVKPIHCEDFIQEAKNSEKAAHNFEKNSWVRIPRVYWVDDLGFLNQMGINPLKVAEALIYVFAEMIFVHGFLHGDPHPGNILVALEGSNSFSLVILDHGIYRQLSEDFRKKYCQLWEALITLDSQKIQLLGETFGVGKYARYFPVIFTGRTINS